MTNTSNRFRYPTWRTAGCHLARFGVVLSAVMLAVSIAGVLGSAAPTVRAQTSAGEALVVSAQLPTTGQPISSGGSATLFSLQLPVGAECTGDSASSDYRVQSYMVPATVDPATLTYGVSGPVPTGTGDSFRQPLFIITSQRYVNQTTGVAVAPGGGGPVPTLPGFNFAPFGANGPTIVPPGVYNVGIACTRAGGTVLDKYWNTQLRFAADPNDEPSGITWETVESEATTTTSTTTTTTTTVAGTATTTTTTVAGGTTTTTAAGGTTSTTVAGGPTDAIVTPSSPTPGGSYRVAFPNCSIGETVTFEQTASTPSSVTDVCEGSTALESGSVAGFRRPSQATTGTATASFTAAPTAPGTYTVTMTGTVSGVRTTTFTIIGAATPIGGGGGGTGGAGVNTGGGSTGTNSSSSGTIPSTGSSTTSLVVWGLLLLVFGRMAILLGRKPKVLTGP